MLSGSVHSLLLWCHFITAHVLTSAYTIYISCIVHTQRLHTVLLRLVLQGLWCGIFYSVGVTERAPATPQTLEEMDQELFDSTLNHL